MSDDYYAYSMADGTTIIGKFSTVRRHGTETDRLEEIVVASTLTSSDTANPRARYVSIYQDIIGKRKQANVEPESWDIPYSLKSTTIVLGLIKRWYLGEDILSEKKD